MKRTELSLLLDCNESLGEPLPSPDEYDYTVYPVATPGTQGVSNTVVFDVASRTEYVHVTGKIHMQIRALSGEGDAVILRASGEQTIQVLAPTIGAVAIGPGDTYYYMRTGGALNVVLRDDCRPPYQDGDEIQMELVVAYSPRAGDYLLLWNPRQPGGAAIVGGVRLALLESHDTTAQNAGPRGQSKYRPVQPHWHAAAQRVNSADIWPVNVAFTERTVHIAPHQQAGQALIGEQPYLAVQEDHLLFRAVAG